MKKRISAFVLVLAAMCMVLAACGEDKNNTDNTVDTPVASETDTVTENDTEEPDNTQEVGMKKITLSGNAEDTFVAEEDCYTEGEDVVLYFAKGLTVRGDMLEITEYVMEGLEGTTGLNFKHNSKYNDYIEFRGEYLTGDFSNINVGAEKINVIIAYDPEGAVYACAYENGAVLDASDYDFEFSGYQTIYHELAHVIHLRNAADLSSAMNEGYAEYFSHLALKYHKLPSWTHIQYFDPYDYDQTPITQGREGFNSKFPSKIDNYHYGFRFVMFLEDTYGEGTFMKIAKEAEVQKYDASYDYYFQEESIKEDTDQLAEIIISQTSEDVFERFTDWNETEFRNKYQEYKDYMNSIGQDINW